MENLIDINSSLSTDNVALGMLCSIGLGKLPEWLLSNKINSLSSNAIWEQVSRTAQSYFGRNTKQYNLFCISYTWRANISGLTDTPDIFIRISQVPTVAPHLLLYPLVSDGYLGDLVIAKVFNPKVLDRSTVILERAVPAPIQKTGVIDIDKLALDTNGMVQDKYYITVSHIKKALG